MSRAFMYWVHRGAGGMFDDAVLRVAHDYPSFARSNWDAADDADSWIPILDPDAAFDFYRRFRATL